VFFIFENWGNFPKKNFKSMTENQKNIPQNQPNNPLHGIKLVDILEFLVDEYGWDELGERIDINCFQSNPSIKSSLKFLRKTPWARAKVEKLYLNSI
jgi:uncharacterized protein (DUF2132 family)